METEKLRFWDNVLIKVEQGKPFYNSNGRIVAIIGGKTFVYFGKRFKDEFRTKLFRIKSFEEGILEKFNLEDQEEIRAQRIFGQDKFYTIDHRVSNDGLCTLLNCERKVEKKVMINISGRLVIAPVCKHHTKLNGRQYTNVNFKKGGFQS